jgi:hypothetical protein
MIIEYVCPYCAGNGTILVWTADDNGDVTQSDEKCPICVTRGAPPKISMDNHQYPVVEAEYTVLEVAAPASGTIERSE